MRQKLFERLRDNGKALETLQILAEASHLLNSTIEYDELLVNVLKLVTRAVNANAAMVYRYDEKRNDLRGRFFSGVEDPQAMTFQMGQGFVGWVAVHKEAVISSDPTHDPRYRADIKDLSDMELKSIIAYPLHLRGNFFGVIEAINKIEGEFDQTDLDTFELLSDQIALAINNALLYRDAKQQALQRETLFEVSAKLMSSLTLESVLHNILTALQKVVDFDAGGIYLIDDENGAVESITSIGYDPAVESDLHLKIGQGIVGSVARTGQSEIIPDTSKDERYINARQESKSEIVVPVMLTSRMIGVFNLENDHLDAFTQEDLDILTIFATQAAISIERARLHRYMLEQKKLEEQLSIARTIQKTFLPDAVPDIKGYDIWGTNIASGEVGGDYFDFIKIVENQLGVTIADVSGKGIPASLIMASFRASLIAEIRNNYAIRTICRKVNNLLCESLEIGNFVTAIYGVLDTKNNIFTFSNCGHNPGIMLRADGSIEELFEGGLLLGIRRDSHYEERPVYINAGDILCLYTDGVTEAEDMNGVQFETDRMIKILTKHRDEPASRIGQRIVDAVMSFSRHDQALDDLTLIIIKRR